MTFHGPSFRKLAVSTFLLSLPFNSAFAQDATAIADRLKASLAAQNVEIEWTGVTGDASSMVLEGVSIKPAGEKAGFPIGNVTLDNVTEANGGFNVGTLTTLPYSLKEKEADVSVSAVVVHDMAIPASDATGPLGSMMLYKSIEVENATVKVKDKTVFTIDGIRADVTPPADGSAMSFSGGADGFSADLSQVEDPKTKDVVEALGYQNITGNFKLNGSWQPSDGKLELTKYDITVDNAATLGISVSLSGYTLDFLKSLQDMQKKMAEQPEGADNSAQGMAMLGLLQQLTFNSAAIRINDASLTNKILDYVGKQQGMSGKDVANQAKAIVPFGLAQLNNPELTTQASAAVNTYLDDPKSIEIYAAPPAPVPFALIMAGAMSNPADLTKTLGVSVKANQD